MWMEEPIRTALAACLQPGRKERGERCAVRVVTGEREREREMKSRTMCSTSPVSVVWIRYGKRKR